MGLNGQKRSKRTLEGLKRRVYDHDIHISTLFQTNT